MVTFASLFREKERLIQERVESAVKLELRAWYMIKAEVGYCSLYFDIKQTIHTQENTLLHNLWTV